MIVQSRSDQEGIVFLQTTDALPSHDYALTLAKLFLPSIQTAVVRDSKVGYIESKTLILTD